MTSLFQRKMLSTTWSKPGAQKSPSSSISLNLSLIHALLPSPFLLPWSRLLPSLVWSVIVMEDSLSSSLNSQPSTVCGIWWAINKVDHRSLPPPLFPHQPIIPPTPWALPKSEISVHYHLKPFTISNMAFSQESPTFLCKERANILGFMGHIVSVATIQLCFCSVKAAIYDA